MTKSELSVLRVGDIVKEYTVMGWAYGPARGISDAYLKIEFGWGTKFYVFDDPSSISLMKLESSDPTADELRLKHAWMNKEIG